MIASTFRLRKHADYQRVYQGSRKKFGKHLSYFFLLRGTPPDHVSPGEGPRIGLTVGKVMGKAVDRNRMKRRMREAVRRKLSAVSAPVDIVLHPRRDVLDLEFSVLEREIDSVFRAVQIACTRTRVPPVTVERPVEENAGGVKL